MPSEVIIINGHEPCGQIVAMGQGCRHFKEGDRVLVYHISGCGFCPNCRRGFPISCTGKGKAAYGWQRDGGHAEYLLAEEKDLILLPDALSYEDGAFILLLKKAFKPLQLLQFGMAFLLGSLVNFFYYDVLSQLAVPAYSLSIVFLLIGNGINAAAVALILSLNIVTFPVGGLVLAVSQVTNSAYGKCRQGLDGICILIILILVFGFHGEMTLREGTIVSMLMFGPLVDRFMSLFQIYLKKGARI